MNHDTSVESADALAGEVAEMDDCSLAGADAVTLPKPVVRIREEHNVSRRDIDPEALKVLYRLSRNNFTAYLVGGGVRDLLLGRKPKDFDISTDAKPEQIRALFRNCILIGRRFRLAHIRYGDKIIETSTFRRTPECAGDPSDPETDLFQRNDNLFGTPQEDALRRDFTVNGLFYDIESFSIIDYVGGIDDLAARRIRSIGDPCIRFREDPVRMIRAVRFASRLDFTLDPETLDAILKHGDELAKAAPARLLEEITRLFAFASGEKAVRLLHTTGLLRVILPEVADCLGDETYDRERFWQRLRALDLGDTVLPDATPALIFATLLLDPLQRKLERGWSAEEFPRLKFEKVHAFLEPISQRLRFPRKLVDRIVHMYLSQHRFVHNAGGKRGSIANFVTQDSFHESLALAEILTTAEGGSQARLSQWRDMLAERIYGREEGAPERQRQAGGNGTGNNNGHVQNSGQNQNADGEHAAVAEAGDDDLSGGKKLSRSARRRRNKRLKRQRTTESNARPDGNGEAAPASPESAPSSAEAPEGVVHEPAAPTAPASEAASAPQAEPQAVAEPSSAEPAKKSRAARSRDRGNRHKKKAESQAEQPPAAPVELENYQPLTAASFYAKPPEPVEPEKKEKGGRKRGKSADAQRNGDKAGDAGQDEAAPEKRKPLSMDRADEADIPMHWLDEI